MHICLNNKQNIRKSSKVKHNVQFQHLAHQNHLPDLRDISLKFFDRLFFFNGALRNKCNTK